MPRPRVMRVFLQEQEADKLKALVENENTNVTIRKRCLILLYADESGGLIRPRQDVADLARVSIASVRNVIRQYLLFGLDDALEIHRNVNSDTACLKVDERIQQVLLDLLASEPPGGTVQWSLRSLSRQLEIETGIRLGTSTIGRTLHKLRQDLP